jgi:putative DNA primase/helicase
MQHARTALSFIPNDDRDIWLKMAMAIKSEFGEEGFDMWDAWSSTDPSYKPADAKAVWKSANATKTTIASLFFEAKKYGYKPESKQHIATPEEIAERAKAREQAQAMPRSPCRGKGKSGARARRPRARAPVHHATAGVDPSSSAVITMRPGIESVTPLV